MSIKGHGHSLTLVKGHSDFKVKCLTFGLYTQVSDSGPLGPLVFVCVCVCVCVCERGGVVTGGMNMIAAIFCIHLYMTHCHDLFYRTV